MSDASSSLTVPVVGMTCGGCVSSVERATKRVAGVADARASLKPGAVTVTAAPGAVVQREAVVKAIEAAGFSVPAD